MRAPLRFVQVNNSRRYGGGADDAVDDTRRLLVARGHHVYAWLLSSSALAYGWRGKVRAFVSGIYSRSAYQRMRQIIAAERPEIVLVHNVYPFFSPSILLAARRAGIPVVMICHTYYLTCPTGMHLFRGETCEKCRGGHEYWCVLRNCRSVAAESLGYAMRSAVARRFRLFHNNVTVFIAWTEGFRRDLGREGFDESRIVVVPRICAIPDSGVDPAKNSYAAFAGRISPEKGLETLMKAAAALPTIPFRIAGDWSAMLRVVEQAPENVVFVGKLARNELATFYREARFLVVPSLCLETFCAVAGEAMSHGLPVVASRRGALIDLVEEGRTGVLFEPGDSDDLRAKVMSLWKDPEYCRRMGRAGREKILARHNEHAYYTNLIGAFEQARAIWEGRLGNRESSIG